MSPANAICLDADCIRGWPLPVLAGDIDKNGRGRVLLVAGSRQVPGGAVLAAESALRAGAGKVTVATSAAVATAMAIALPETRVVGLLDLPSGGLALSGADCDSLGKGTDVILIGPGLQDEAATQILVQQIVRAHTKVPVILDASAIAAVRQLDAANTARPVLITPHLGEAAHFWGLDRGSIAGSQGEVALGIARRWHCITALKGASTLLATPQGRLYRHDGGNEGLAISGSGDCLAGIIAGLVARGATLEQAALWGIFLHGRAGARLGADYGGIGYLAREIPPLIPQLIARQQAR